MKRGMIDAPCIEQWTEEIDSEITPVLELLGERMKHIDINSCTGGGGVGVGMPELAAFEDKWEGQLNEVAYRIDGMAVFSGGRQF